MSASAAPRFAAPSTSANADWIRGLQRTAAIAPTSPRTLAAVVAEYAQAHGERPALVGTDGTLTYAGLAARAGFYAGWARRQGLSKGDRVALLLANQPDYAAIWIGLSQVGVVTALLNTQLARSGLSHCLSLADADHLIVGINLIDALDDLDFAGTCWTHGGQDPRYPRVDASSAALESEHAPIEAVAEITLQDPALLIYTSGTTGLPKAAHVSHYRIMMWSEWFAGILDASSSDRLYDCLPMYHSIGGVAAVGAMLVAGGAVIVRTGFSASRFWPDVAASGATIFQYIGELCRYLLAAPPPEAPHCLRICIGNGLRADVWETFAKRFALPRVIEFYAATEGSFSLFNLEGRLGAIGRIPGFMAHRSPVARVPFA